jgi:hypothetical protein
MQKYDLKKLLPYIGSLLIFIILTVAYVNPVLEGKQLMQSDIVKFAGMSKEIVDFRKATGEEALWTNSMFSGMPAFQISVIYSNNISKYLHSIMTLGLPRPADMIFLYFAGFFIFMLVLGMGPWISFLGAVAFAFSSYNFIIIDAGHNSKAVAIAYMAPVLASIIYTFRGHYLAGGILFSIFLALQLFSNHLQITYYLLFVVVFYGIFELIRQYKQGLFLNFMKASLVLIAGAILAIGVNIGNFWSTLSYTSETMRGGTELSFDERLNTSGLTAEYITQWSYGIEETLSLLIPNAKGGASRPMLLDELIAMNQGTALEQREARAKLDQYDPRFVNFIVERLQAGQSVSNYWGDQPFTSGPVYIGAIVMFLFVLSLFYVRGPLKWGLLAAIILSVLLSWGKNFQWFTDLFILYVPGYNKFRAVSMILVIAGMCIPILAFLGLHKWYHNPGLLKIKSPAFYTAAAATAGLIIVLFIMPGVFLSFFTQQEKLFLAGADSQLLMNYRDVENARISIFRADALRSLIFVGLAMGVIVLFVSSKINKTVFVALLALLIVVDMWPVNKRYFDNSNFVSRRQIENPYQPTQADLRIMQDTDPHYRVYNVTVNSFNDSSTSWFHKSIGGYHGAKLQRYQEIIDFHITAGNMKVLNMLNTKYFIVPGQDRSPQPSLNPDALGNAWFVSEIQWVENADEEIALLHDFDPETTVLIDRRFEDQVGIANIADDTLARIQLTRYQPNQLNYYTVTTSDQLAVFSEIYYPDGWKVFINGEETEHFRVNYLLRGMVVPAGEHEIVFRFEPRSYYTGQKIALLFSILLVLTILAFVGKNVYEKRNLV